jgi:hypothetical protein
MGEKNSSLGLSSFPPYYFLRRRKILNHWWPGLPDGITSSQKSQSG